MACVNFWAATYLFGIIEGVHGIKPSVTLDFMSNSPLLYMYKKAKCNLLGGFCSLSDVTEMFLMHPFN